jgi:hypothetical protein
MGTGFTIDTPLKVARYGISSVMSVEDNLMEKMRERYSHLWNEAFVPIAKSEPDSRARRITAYLNLVQRIVNKQVADLRSSPFEEYSEITRYFELLDDQSDLKKSYLRMLDMPQGSEKELLQMELRNAVIPGSIDINILTKLDREGFRNGVKLPREHSDGLAALRGFALSELSSSVVFSAGLNPYLYTYAENFEDFYADEDRPAKKKIIIKVSDFRSAYIQGKIFAKKGIWVYEFRIESGLNCGGHAFPTAGILLGPILEEFKNKKEEFTSELFEIYRKALAAKKGFECSIKPPTRITVQGGIGTEKEDRFLRRYYALDSTGWGTPFLLVPEVTCVEADTLKKLVEADENSVYLSGISPLGVPFYSLRNTTSDQARLERIKEGKPGSPCFNKYMAFNTEFSEVPICTASSHYQGKKIEELEAKHLSPQEFSKEYEKIVEKSCICHDLGDGALMKYHIPYKGMTPTPAICPGPNLIYFSRIFSLKEMVGHIYGRVNLLNPNRPRPHVFINELKLYVDYLKSLVTKAQTCMTSKDVECFSEFRQNLESGIEYYKKQVNHFVEESKQSREKFLADLEALRLQIEFILDIPAPVPAAKPV